MKDYLYSNYDIYVDKIYYINDKQFFFLNDYKICIIKVYENIDYFNKLIDLTNNLYSSINVDTFILNKYNNYFTKYDNYNIVLLRVNHIEDEFSLEDIFKFWNVSCNLNNYNILSEWETEIDNLEKKLVEYNNEFKVIKLSVDYYIGMAENAIELLNDYQNQIINNDDSIGHKVSFQLFYDNSLFNPFSFIKTNKMFDISNYIKYKFLRNEIDYNEVESFFINGNEYENIFLFSNLLYPSVYFDLLNNVLLGKEKENSILVYLKRRKKYVKLLSFCKKIVKNNKNVRLINWFDK